MKTLAELTNATRPFTAADLKREWRLWWQTLAVYLAFLFIAAAPLPLALRVSGSLFAGLTLIRIFIFYHDYLHGAIFRGSRPFSLIMHLYGLFVLSPASSWKRSHNYHHQFNSQIATASIGSFPMMTREQYLAASPGQRLRYRLIRHPLNFLLAFFTVFGFGMCVKPFFTDPRRHWDGLLSLAVNALIFTTLYRLTGPATTLLVYFLPHSVLFVLGSYLFYIQHNFPDMQLKPRQHWDFVFAALHSSSFMDVHPLLHWFTGNIGYHHVHHLNSRIPFYRLPAAMEKIPELRRPGRVSLSPRAIARSFELNVWDPELGKMVKYREATAASGTHLSDAV